MSDVVDRRDRRTISLGLVARATNLRGLVIPPDDKSILWKRVPDQVPPVVDVRQLEDVGTFLPLKDNVVWYIDDLEPIRGVSAKADACRGCHGEKRPCQDTYGTVTKDRYMLHLILLVRM